MSPQELLELPAGKELDILVGKHIFGYQFLEIGYHRLPINGVPQLPDSSTAELQASLRDWLDKPDVVRQYDNGVGEYLIDVLSDYIIPAEDAVFSADMSWAMLVLDKIRGKKDDVRVAIDSLKSGAWSVHLEPRNTIATYTAEAETLPLAICQAALLRAISNAH